MKKLKMGILILSNCWAGAENAFYNLSKNLINNKIEVHLLLNNEMARYYKKMPKLNLHELGSLYSKKKYSWPILFYKIRKNLKRILKEKGIEVILLVLMDATIPSYNLYQKKGLTILTLRGEELRSYSNGKFLNRFFFKKALDNSDLILSVNKWQIQNLPEEYKKKTVVIPNGVDSNVFKPLRSIKQRKNVVLFVGRLIELKGIREILSVAKQLPLYEFWFAGQGPLADLISLSNTKNLGFKNQEELIRLYNQATVCILPSYREGFSNAGLEVTACGKALICTPLGFSEYIEDGKDGMIIPAKDKKALKDAIVELMENPKKRKGLERNARKKALRYSWDKIARQYLKVLKEVVKNENKN